MGMGRNRKLVFLSLQHQLMVDWWFGSWMVLVICMFFAAIFQRLDVPKLGRVEPSLVTVKMPEVVVAKGRQVSSFEHRFSRVPLLVGWCLSPEAS